MSTVIIDVKGYVLDVEEKEILTHPLIAGVILFTRNFDNISQLKELVKEIRFYAKNQVLIAVDHEGGRVQRFREDFTILPSAGSLLKLNDLNKAKQLAYSSAWVMASELIACDIDLSFAPVIDLNGISDVIQERAFSSEVKETIILAESYIMGMKSAGMVATGKHFPGHGSVKADSHIALPVDTRSKQAIFKHDILPFKALIEKGLLDAIMPSHVVYSECDNQPAGFSSYWLNKVLKKQLAFKGVIISDDLSMHGASFVGNHVSRAKNALNAGCDLILACNDRQGAISILDHHKVLHVNNRNSVNRLRCTKEKFEVPLIQNPIWRENQQKLLHFADII